MRVFLAYVAGSLFFIYRFLRSYSSPVERHRYFSFVAVYQREVVGNLFLFINESVKARDMYNM